MNLGESIVTGAGMGLGLTVTYWALTSLRDFIGGIFGWDEDEYEALRDAARDCAVDGNNLCGVCHKNFFECDKAEPSCVGAKARLALQALRE